MKILLPIDHSDCAIATLKWAVHTFDKSVDRFCLLTAVSVYPDVNELEYDVMDAKALLARAKEALLEQGAKHVDAEYVVGDIVDSICQYADETQADLVVVGSHGKSALKRAILGSISADILESCHRPVILYRNVESAKPIHLS